MSGWNGPVPDEGTNGDHLASVHGWDLWYVVHIYRSFGAGGLHLRHMAEHTSSAEITTPHQHREMLISNPC